MVINPGDRRLHVDRVIALPELYGPCVRGIPLSEHGFLRVDPYGRVLDAEGVYAAGDCTEFPVKHGGVGSQQADVVAQSIAADGRRACHTRAVSPCDPRDAAHRR